LQTINIILRKKQILSDSIREIADRPNVAISQFNNGYYKPDEGIYMEAPSSAIISTV
jgi:hypothetical protein